MYRIVHNYWYCKKKVGVAFKLGVTQHSNLLWLFFNNILSCPESLDEIDQPIKDCFKFESIQLLFFEVIFDPDASWTSSFLTSKFKFYCWLWKYFCIEMCWKLIFFEIWINLKKVLKASRLWRLIIDKKQCVPVACQCKFAEKIGAVI